MLAKNPHARAAAMQAAAATMSALIAALDTIGMRDDLQFVASDALIRELGRYADVSNLARRGSTQRATEPNSFGVSAEDFVRESIDRCEVVFSVEMAIEACKLMDLKGDTSTDPHEAIRHLAKIVDGMCKLVPRIHAKWIPQTWIDGKAFDADGEFLIDITDVVLDLPHDAAFLTGSGGGQRWLEGLLQEHPLQQDHGGPFRCHADASLNAFFQDVAARDLGQSFTKDQWEAFTQGYREMVAALKVPGMVSLSRDRQR